MTYDSGTMSFEKTTNSVCGWSGLTFAFLDPGIHTQNKLTIIIMEIKITLLSAPHHGNNLADRTCDIQSEVTCSVERPPGPRHHP